MRILAGLLAVLASGCSDPDAGGAHWTVPRGVMLPTSMFNVAWAERTGDTITVFTTEYDEAVQCSTVRGLRNGSLSFELSRAAAETVGVVPIDQAPLVAGVASAHGELGSRGVFASGELVNTAALDRFDAMFTAITTSGDEITGSFTAPLCD